MSPLKPEPVHTVDILYNETSRSSSATETPPTSLQPNRLTTIVHCHKDSDALIATLVKDPSINTAREILSTLEDCETFFTHSICEKASKNLRAYIKNACKTHEVVRTLATSIMTTHLDIALRREARAQDGSVSPLGSFERELPTPTEDASL